MKFLIKFFKGHRTLHSIFPPQQIIRCLFFSPSSMLCKTRIACTISIRKDLYYMLHAVSSALWHQHLCLVRPILKVRKWRRGSEKDAPRNSQEMIELRFGPSCVSSTLGCRSLPWLPLRITDTPGISIMSRLCAAQVRWEVMITLEQPCKIRSMLIYTPQAKEIKV